MDDGACCNLESMSSSGLSSEPGPDHGRETRGMAPGLGLGLKAGRLGTVGRDDHEQSRGCAARRVRV